MSKHKCDCAKRVDATCRNHGSCPHCRGSRTYQTRREGEAAQSQIDEWKKEK